MNNKAIFLGTGGDSIVVGQQARATGGLVLQINDNQFHVDPGPGSLVRAKQFGINIRENTALIVTNDSLLRSNDINAVLEAMTHSGLDKKGVLLCNKTIFSGRENHASYLTEKHRILVERVITLEQNSRVGINDIELRTFPAKNNDPNAIGLKFITARFAIGYASDTEFSEDIARAYSDCNILILNVPNPQDIKKDGELCSKSAASFIKTANPKLAIITSFGVKMINADPIAQAREIQKESGIETIAATDGLRVDLESRSIISSE